MLPETTSAFSTVTAGIVMLYVGTRKHRLEFRWLRARCPACGKLYRRGRVCPCSRK